MPSYHPDAAVEVQNILAAAGRSVKWCLGMMLKRHLLMDSGTAPLTDAEALYAGSGASTLYEVEYSYNLWGRLTCVYETASVTTLLAADAWQGVSRVGSPRGAPDARARAWGRSS
jgi:hypothetical protein